MMIETTAQQLIIGGQQYARSVKLSREFVVVPDGNHPGGVVVPINGHVAVISFRADQARLKRTGNGPEALDDNTSVSEAEGEADGHGGGGKAVDGDMREDLLTGDGRGGGRSASADRPKGIDRGREQPAAERYA